MRADQLLPVEKQALEHLIQLAQGDPGQSRRVADFLLAWWNAGECGAFDLTTAWGVDDAIAEDMATVFRFALRAQLSRCARLRQALRSHRARLAPRTHYGVMHLASSEF